MHHNRAFFPLPFADEEKNVADIGRNWWPEESPPSEDVAAEVAVLQGLHWCAFLKVMPFLLEVGIPSLGNKKGFWVSVSGFWFIG